MKKWLDIGVSLAIVVLAWAVIGRPQSLPDIPSQKLDCLSYTPFRGDETPFDKDYRAPYDNIQQDLRQLKTLTDCVRIYAVDQGLDQVLPIARQLKMQVLMGLWIGRDPEKNDEQIEKGIALARQYPDEIRAIIVGNEVLLRGELTPEALAVLLERVRKETGSKITYADVWEFWLKAPILADKVDFITIHILPYWEDDPVPASEGVEHFRQILDQTRSFYPGKEIFVGETGYPSHGRQRENAIPSLYAQAQYLREFAAYATQEGVSYNFIEAFDQPWKRLSEGTVGGYWGLFDKNRVEKFGFQGPVSNVPHWPLYAALGAALAVILVKGRTTPGWLAGILSLLFFMQIDQSLHAFRDGKELMIETLLTLHSLMLLFFMPRFRLGADRKACGDVWSVTLAPNDQPLFYLTSLISVGLVLLGQVFDPRYRDFPLAAFAIPALIFLLFPPKVAEEKYLRAGVAAAAAYVAIGENIGNGINGTALVFCLLAGVIASPVGLIARNRP